MRGQEDETCCYFGAGMPHLPPAISTAIGLERLPAACYGLNTVTKLSIIMGTFTSKLIFYIPELHNGAKLSTDNATNISSIPVIHVHLEDATYLLCMSNFMRTADVHALLTICPNISGPLKASWNRLL